MLSAMTTSENFPLVDRSKCSPVSAYDSVIEPAYVATILRQNLKMASGKDGGHVIDYRLIREGNISGGKISPGISYYLTDSGTGGKNAEEEIVLTGNEEKESATADEFVSAGNVPKSDFESELTDFLDQLDLDDSICEQSKPLKIDPNVLKLDFSKIEIAGNLENLEKLYSHEFSENKRASHHLSGGILLTDASQEQFPETESSKNRLSKLSGGGLIATGNSFNFDRFKTSSPEGNSDFRSNPISASISPAFGLTSRTGNGDSFQSVPVDGGNSYSDSYSESTNPFKKLLDEVRSKGNGETEKDLERRGEEEEENSTFSPTNPFSDFRVSSSSPNETGNGTSDFFPSTPKYENFSLPGKSFSQCSTRPTSPVFKIPHESFPSNPFLLNDCSRLENREEAPPYPCHFFASEPPKNRNSSSFIFAVPIFSFLPQSIITDSSTQTVEHPTSPASARTRLATVAPPPSLPPPPQPPSDFQREKDQERESPVYQNLTNQLNKFIRNSNDHSEYDLNCLRRNLKELRISGWYYEKVSWKESAILLRNSQPGTFLIRDSSDPNFLFCLSVQTCRGPTSVRLHYVNGQFRLDAEEKLIPQLPSFGSVIELIDYYVEKTIANGKRNRCDSSAGEKWRSERKTWKENGEGDVSIGDHQVWIDSRGNVYSNILLAKPLRRSERLSSLQHLARLKINSQLRCNSNSMVKFNFNVTPVYESSPFQDGSFNRNNNFDGFCPILSADSLPLPRKLIDYLRDYPYCH